jgi:hypothetical protein
LKPDGDKETRVEHREESPTAVLTARLRAHVHECERCATEPVAVEPLAAVLVRSGEPPVALSALSLRVLAAAAPLLAANAAHAYRRRLLSSVGLSLAPFPLLVFFNLYLLREAYTLLSSWLPVGFVVWLIVGYAAMLLLVCALVYASIPLLIARARLNPLVPDAPLPSSA